MSEERRKSLSKWGIKVDFEGVHVVGENGEVSDPVKSVADGKVVVDEQGNEFELEGGAAPELSGPGTPKKLLGQFSAGFPKSWSRATNQERKRLRDLARLKQVDWRNLPFVGIEFSAIAGIYAEPFEFPHLARELTEGRLNKPYPIYLFQGAQPCWSDKERTMRNVPYIVAIDCRVAPPDKLVYHTLQLAKHDVIDMKSQPSFARYEWAPYVPRDMQVERAIPVYKLGWAGRGAQFQNMEEADVHRIEFLHPYILLPQVVEKMEPPVVTSVDFTWEHQGKSYKIVFDKEIDRLATFIPEFVEDNELAATEEETSVALKAALVAAFKEKRTKEEGGFKAMQDEVAAMSPETQQALREMRTFKFYPFHPEISIQPFVGDDINPYFGRASEVVLPSAEEVALLKEEYAEQAAALTPRKSKKKEQDELPTGKRARDNEEAQEVVAEEEVVAAPTEEKKIKLDEEKEEN